MLTQCENQIIRASAGTGKTFQLSNRYIRLLAQGVVPEQILATTFTRKAAGEILDRVLQRLAEAAVDDNARAELGQFIEQENLSQERCLDILQKALRQLHRLQISTFDSFFIQTARAFSMELGMPPGWTMIDQQRDTALRSDAIEEVLRRGDHHERLELLHLLTKGATTRAVSRLLHETVQSLYDIFCESESEAWDRLPRFKKLSQGDLDKTIERLRVVALPEGKRWADAREGDVQRAEAGNWEAFIGKGLASKVRSGDPVYYKTDIPVEAVRLYETLLNHAKGVLFEKIVLQTVGTHSLLTKFHEGYAPRKISGSRFRFEDVTRQLADLHDRVADGHLAFRLDTRLSHLLFDEFQDTSLSQWRVLRPMVRSLSQPDVGGSVFCVGDVKQAIYGWRGGVAEVFDEAEEDIANVKSSSLIKSYRSSPPVIETINQIFSRMADHNNFADMAVVFDRWKKKFATHQTNRVNLPGYACLMTARSAEEGETQSEVTIEYAAEKVAQLARDMQGQSIGVLVRTNKTVGQLIALLGRCGVHASEEGGSPLTDSAAVAAVLALMQLVDHPGDAVARFHLANSPLGPKIGLTDFRDAAEARRLARGVRRAILDKGYGDVIAQCASRMAPACNTRETRRLEQLVELAWRYDDSISLRTSRFVEFVALERVADPSTSAVRVMTIHQSKGLQFDAVILPELDEGGSMTGQTPDFVVHRDTPTQPISTVCRYAKKELQGLLPERFQVMFRQRTEQSFNESLCRLYVAVTRPVHALYMIVAPDRPSSRKEKEGSFKFPKKSSGLLRVALSQDERVTEEKVLYQTGDSHWYKGLAAKGSSEGEDNITRVKLPIPFAQKLDRPGRDLDFVSPSSLEGGDAIDMDALLSGDDAFRAAGRLRGSLVHAWFEEIEWLDDGPPDDEKLLQLGSRFPGLPLSAEKVLADFHKMLNHTEIVAALRREYYSGSWSLAEKISNESLRITAENERPFAVEVDGKILQGFIDRVVIAWHEDRPIAADVIDFKTDTVADETVLAEKVAFYKPQIDAYRQAVAQLTGLSPESITGRLLFVSPGIVHEYE